MKLFYIANARIPTEKAHGIQIMQMLSAFASSKLKAQNSKLTEKTEVELVVPYRFNPTKKDAFDYYDVKRNFRIKKIPCLDLIPLDKYLGPLAFWIQAISFAFFAQFYLFFKKPDIVYTRDKFFVFFSLFKKNLFFEIHDFPETKFYFYKKIFSKAKGIISTNKWKKEELIKRFGIKENKVLVAPNGVDLKKVKSQKSKLKIKEELGLPLGGKIIGYVGQLKTMGMEKGIDVLIKALKNLRESSLSTILCLVGGQRSDILEYKKMVRQMGLSEKEVIFIGQVKHNLIPFYLKSFDVLVMPFPRTKHYAYYMSPIKMFEYMTSKKPIIASDLPSIREILNEDNAVLVEPDNSKALAKGIKKVLEDESLAERISIQAYQDVQQYTWQRRAERILEFIESKRKL